MESKQTQGQYKDRNINRKNGQPKCHTKWCTRHYIDALIFHHKELLAKRKTVVNCQTGKKKCKQPNVPKTEEIPQNHP